MNNEERYFLGRDESLHWYLVPLKNKKEWDEWTEISEDDERYWKVPEFAKRIDGYDSITFSNPKTFLKITYK